MSYEEQEVALATLEELDEDGFADDMKADMHDEEQFSETSSFSDISGVYDANEINEEVFQEFHLDAAAVEQAQELWSGFCKVFETPEAVGEAIYSTLFECAPSLQVFFKTPRAVMAVRFMSGIDQIVASLSDPPGLKTVTETVAFQHLGMEITVARVVTFRDALMDLLQAEMPTVFTPEARDAWCKMLNYVGGAIMFVRKTYAERLTILARSWAQATNKTDELCDASGGEESQAPEVGLSETEDHTKASKKGRALHTKRWFGTSRTGRDNDLERSTDSSRKNRSKKHRGGQDRNAAVPKTFNDMFLFNASVMGFGTQGWMQEILNSFNSIVTGISNPCRFQEECDILALRLAKYKGPQDLLEFKSVMLASMRSLAKDWSSVHEISWSWLWDHVENTLKRLNGKPAAHEAALSGFMAGVDEAVLAVIRREVYATFFRMAPTGENYFKQSTTRLHFIADRVLSMTLEMYRNPRRMAEDISALGLRHVGYGIPTTMFGPFVSATVHVVCARTEDHDIREAFSWSLGLISRMLMRVVTEGSTIVMQAINRNSGEHLQRAVACAPRGQRAEWMLSVQVGSQSISPLMWAIETGSFDAAHAIIVDLLTIRGDRDRYYFGMSLLFQRHPEIIKTLCLDAPALLPIFLDGLIWRSRGIEFGQRRVNYYIKHLLVDVQGKFSPTTKWIMDLGDPELVCHDVLVFMTDLVWNGVAFRRFICGKLWFLFKVVIFVLSQAILNRLDIVVDGAPDRPSGKERVAIFALRMFTYLCNLGQWLVYHGAMTLREVRSGTGFRLCGMWCPTHLALWRDFVSFLLTMCLIAMLSLEPTLHCLGSSESVGAFSEDCDAARHLHFPYSVACMAAMLLHAALLTDLSVVSTRVSAFALVCGRLFSEVALFLFAIVFLSVAFACTVSALNQQESHFAGVPTATLNLFRVALGIFASAGYDDMLDCPALAVAIFIYVVSTTIFLLNILVAQLCCAFQASYMDMLGFARLSRGKIVCETMASVPAAAWSRFVEGLHLDEGMEFGQGDKGLPGGVQIYEPASENVVTVDTIRRYAGSTSPSAKWPSEDVAVDTTEDGFQRVEKLVLKALRNLNEHTQNSAGSLISSRFSSSSGD